MHLKLFPLLLFVGVVVSLARAAEPPMKREVHFVSTTETLDDIALRYLGDRLAAEEIRAYNQLDPERGLEEGYPLVIPGEDRTAALEVLLQAGTVRKSAEAQQVHQFAPSEYVKASDVLSAAMAARRKAAYVRAKVLGELAVEQFNAAMQVADRLAVQPQEAQLLLGEGEILVFDAEAASWLPCGSEARLPAGAQFRVGRGGRASLILPGNDQLTLKGPASLRFDTLLQDQRSKRTETALHLLQGEVRLLVESPRDGTSSFMLSCAGASLRFGTGEFRAQTPLKDEALISMLSGEAVVQSTRGTLSVKSGKCVRIKAGATTSVVGIPEAPLWITPSSSPWVTVEQELNLEWTGQKGKPTYTVELSLDETFRQLLHRRETAERSLRGPFLDPETYFIRVSANRKGVAGRWSDITQLTVNRDLEIAFAPFKSVDPEGQSRVAPRTRIQALPQAQPSSVRRIAYSVNGQAFTEATEGIYLPETGRFQIRARGIGPDEVSGPEIETQVVIDGEKPQLRLHIGEVFDFPGYGAIRSLALLVDDNVAMGETRVRINQGEWNPYELPLKLSASESHRIEVRAEDALGNIAETSLTLDAFAQKERAVDEVLDAKKSSRKGFLKSFMRSE